MQEINTSKYTPRQIAREINQELLGTRYVYGQSGERTFRIIRAKVRVTPEGACVMGRELATGEWVKLSAWESQ